VLSLSVLRLLWRLVNPVPPLPAGLSPTLAFAAHATHWLFYFLIIAIPLAGWAMVSSSPIGLPTMYFGLFQWPAIPFLADLPRADKVHAVVALAMTHNYLAFTAVGLLVLHVGAALWHQIFRHDVVLRRMLPFTSVPETAT
jgi:cytochrome b561